jgi:NTE family protein
VALDARFRGHDASVLSRASRGPPHCLAAGPRAAGGRYPGAVLLAELAPIRALVLGGGNALGAYLAGAYDALHAAGETPDWIAGSSIGAITAALIAGNPAERRLERLRAYWQAAAAPEWIPVWRGGSQWAAALQARLLGRPTLFRPSGAFRGETVGLFDTAPLRRTLEALIDFDRLNGGTLRVSLQSVDLESGEAVAFDSARERLSIEHVLASAAMIPDFPPVRVGARWLVDGGLVANVPVDLVLDPLPDRDCVCYLVDLFPLTGPKPRDLAGMSMRQTDLIFACQTARTVRRLADLHAARAQSGAPHASIDLVAIAYRGYDDETALKSWDYAAETIARRWDAGRADMARALAAWRAAPPGTPGFRVHAAPGDARR